MASNSNQKNSSQDYRKNKAGFFESLFMVFTDFMKKCSDDHIAAFGAMSAFFFILSLFPFLILLLTLTKTLPFSKNDILTVISRAISFEPSSLIISVVNEVYQKTGRSVFTFSILTAIWSSSKGVYSIVLGLNSVYDIEEERNYLVLRSISALYTLVFLVLVIFMMLLWVFGMSLYHLIEQYIPFFASFARSILYRRTVISIFLLTTLFMGIYKFVPGRKSKFVHQLPGALVASLGWVLVSWGCSFYVDHFSSFTLVYGSMASIMLILLWLYFCMSLIFYGAEFNYFLENKRNYHVLVRSVRPAMHALKRRREEHLRKLERDELRKKQEQKKFQKMLEMLDEINRKKNGEK